MTAKRQDITIEQGADYDKPFLLADDTGEAEDLTGASAYMEFRTSYDDPTALLSLSSGASTLRIDTEDGEIQPLIGPLVTAAFLPGVLVYDLFVVYASGKTRRKRFGKATISPRVTNIPAPSPSPAPSPAPAPDALQKDDGGYILQDDGSKILL